MAMILAENEVSNGSIHALFVNAFFKAENRRRRGYLHYRRFRVPDLGLYRRRTAADTNVHVCQLGCRRPFAHHRERANHLNATIILPAFYVRKGEPGKLYAHYFMSYSDGVIDSHIINLARRFSDAVIFGARQLLDVQVQLH